jgi:hypothetical protein
MGKLGGLEIRADVIVTRALSVQSRRILTTCLEQPPWDEATGRAGPEVQRGRNSVLRLCPHLSSENFQIRAATGQTASRPKKSIRGHAKRPKERK